MKIIITALLLLSCQVFIFSQVQLDLKGPRFRLYPDMEKYEPIRFWGQNLEPIFTTNPLTTAEFQKYKTGKTILAISLGVYSVGGLSILLAIGTSDQTGAWLGPNIDDNKKWVVSFGGISFFTGLVGMISSRIYSQVKLKKAVKLYNLGGDTGYYFEYSPQWKLQTKGSSVGVQLTF
ncbi:MAG: hypothetical protein KDC34_20730 [Saprospiraceae bacterium]|nr:hypothetical protein [Saprospiraceae bacterium]